MTTPKKKRSIAKSGNVPQETFLRIVGQKIMVRRVELKMTLTELAKKSNVTSITISKIEKNGIDNIGVSTLKKITDAVGLKLIIDAE